MAERGKAYSRQRLKYLNDMCNVVFTNNDWINRSIVLYCDFQWFQLCCLSLNTEEKRTFRHSTILREMHVHNMTTM